MFTDQQILQAAQQSGASGGKDFAVMLGGSGGITHASFYMHATLDAEATEREGRKIYREAPYVKLWAEGSKDQADHIVGPEDRKQYPQEWAAFEAHRANPQHSVTHLPGFSAVHFRYCEDAKIFTIEALVAADVQPELKALQAMGARWLALLMPEAKQQVHKGWPKGKPRKKGADVLESQNPA